MKKILVILIMLFVLTGCSTKEPENIEENPFELDVSFPHYKAEEMYYKYNHYYAGMFYDDNHALTMAVVEGAPEYVLASIEQAGLEILIVQHSEAKLQAVRAILESRMVEYEIHTIGTSQKDNWINIRVEPDVIISEDLTVYINEGIIHVEYSDLVVTH